ncbi:MAG TPA: response regulator [Polyangiaceae bacterium]|jgi:two-component system phosphate regulon response regulator PhoB|nr:response regulator [Polyangiaceae bacterium]
MAKVLVVEDETDLQEVLRFNLQQAGYEPLVAGTGADAIRLAERFRPDVVLLDLMLPDILGTEVCRTLKQGEETRLIPIIMLTAKAEERSRVEGFEIGADDYVTKPFSVRELLFRVAAILRRTQPSVQQTGPIVFGRLRIDPQAHRAWVDDELVELSALEFRLLMDLYERRDRVQSRTRLLDDVWGVTAEVTTRTVDTHVKRLREKLGEARDYIETVRGVGYRFVGTPDEVKREPS